MVENFGTVLRSCRETKGLTQGQLAARSSYSKAVVGRVEAGLRAPTWEQAHRWDEVLGTTPFLAAVYEIEGVGDDVRRRALFSAAAAGAVVATVGGHAAVADVVHAGLHEALGDAVDWDALVASFARQLVIAPSDALGAALGAQLFYAREVITTNSTDLDAIRGAARLGHLYGLWSGNRGQLSTAHSYYRTAEMYARRCGDPATHSFVLGRTASRGVYENVSAVDTLATADKALAIGSRPSLGHLEAHSARVHVHTLVGNRRAAVVSLRDMERVIDGLPAGERDGADPQARLASFANYVYGRVGTPDEADAAFVTAGKLLTGVPVWWIEARIYRGVALARRGDVSGALGVAEQALADYKVPVHTIGVAVNDLRATLPAGEGEDLLAAHAAGGPMPWETLRV